MEFLKKYYGFLIGIIVLIAYFFSFTYPISEVEKEALEGFNLVNVHIGIARFLIISLLVLCFAFFVYGIYQKPKSGIRFAIGAGALVLLFFICYLSSSTDASELGLQDKIDSKDYKLVGGMITTTIVLLVAGILVLIGLSIKNMISNAKA